MRKEKLLAERVQLAEAEAVWSAWIVSAAAVVMVAPVPMLALVGCQSDCEEGSPQETLLSMPIVGVDTANRLIELEMEGTVG